MAEGQNRDQLKPLMDHEVAKDLQKLLYVRFGSPVEIKQRSISINKIIDPVSGTNISLQNNIAVKAKIWYYHNLINEQLHTAFVFGRSGNGGAFGLQPGLLSMVPVSIPRIGTGALALTLEPAKQQ
ncbi:MAG: hypothetical protein U5J63_13160 [Fodinibius sp.]|nr:hypothetical protein [Fodinibius sp.]